MTPEIKQELRANCNMKAFTFFLDDVTKLDVLKKLRSLGLDTKKGALSATIRVLLQDFATNPATTITKELIETEYLFTTAKNKRSSL